MKEMVYKKMPHMPEILDNGEIVRSHKYQYYIISYGTFPCAYVRVPENHIMYNCFRICHDQLVSVHGGITYEEWYLFAHKPVRGHWIGWDYGHASDYIGGLINVPKIENCGKRWTTQELLDDVISVCNQLEECVI